MTQCKKVKGVKRQVCIGSMDKLVRLKKRSLGAPTDNSVDYTEEFEYLEDVWANISTISKGPVFFDGANVLQQATHFFKIYYRAGTTAEIWVEYEDKNYDVFKVEDLDERHEFLFLYAIQKGSKDIPVNQI